MFRGVWCVFRELFRQGFVFFGFELKTLIYKQGTGGFPSESFGVFRLLVTSGGHVGCARGKLTAKVKGENNHLLDGLHYKFMFISLYEWYIHSKIYCNFDGAVLCM